LPSFVSTIARDLVVWVFVGLDLLAAVVEYASLVIPQAPPISIPSYVYWALPATGLIWASFRAYASAQESYGVKARQLERDRQFFDQLTDTLPSTATISWLRTYDFAAAFDLDWLSGLYQFMDKCRNPEFEFIDKELEELKVALFSAADQFAALVGKETFPLNTPSRLLNRIPQEISHSDPQRFQVIGRSINDAARQVVSAYDRLVKRARRKL
jgi:hypothetical protein